METSAVLCVDTNSQRWHDSKQSFRSNVRSFNPLEKRGCQGRSAPDRGSGVSPGSFPFSRAACGGAQKERKGVFRGHLEPRQRAGRPLQSRLRSGPKSLEQEFLKFALCHVVRGETLREVL